MDDLFATDLTGCPRPDTPTMGALEPACDVPQPPAVMLASILDATLLEFVVFFIMWLGVGAVVAVLVAHWLRRRG